jgi:hypothetical protein
MLRPKSLHELEECPSFFFGFFEKAAFDDLALDLSQNRFGQASVTCSG